MTPQVIYNYVRYFRKYSSMKGQTCKPVIISLTIWNAMVIIFVYVLPIIFQCNL